MALFTIYYQGEYYPRGQYSQCVGTGGICDSLCLRALKENHLNYLYQSWYTWQDIGMS